jgi:hypothetical protein
VHPLWVNECHSGRLRPDRKRSWEDPRDEESRGHGGATPFDPGRTYEEKWEDSSEHVVSLGSASASAKLVLRVRLLFESLVASHANLGIRCSRSGVLRYTRQRGRSLPYDRTLDSESDEDALCSNRLTESA